ncbi:MAG: protein phosphatase 2C domain-containing protein [Candidatus Paceibacterota bacterium]|jgi:hypothetical protein
MKKRIVFSADHYFHIGAPHLTGGKPCQDYALSGVCGDVAYAVVSDGCSTGGNTDVGSRLVALSTVVAIKKFASGNKRGERLSEDVSVRQCAVLAGTREMLGLSIPDLYATSIYACLSREGGYAAVHGDGVIAFKYRSGAMEIIRYDWLDNIPYYPAYAGAGDEAFVAAHGGNSDAPRFSEEHWRCEPCGEWIREEKKELTLREGMAGMILGISKEKIENELAFVAVFSDGITQIEKTELTAAVSKFMSYKNIRGEFVKRRSINAVKEVQKSGLQIMDDIANAVISIEEFMEEEEVPT